MNAKPKVLLFVDWFWPGFRAGGPIQSCINLIRALKDYVDFSVITNDRDLGMDEPYPNVLINKWQLTPEGTRVFYASPKITYLELKTIVKSESFAIMSLNSMYSRKFTQWPLSIALGDKKKNYEIVLSPRGMLATGALSLKPLKKKIYLNAFRLLGIHRKLIWHATSTHEKLDIHTEFGKAVQVRVVPNLPVLVSNPRLTQNKKKGEANFISVARISPEKNTLFVIRAFMNAKGKVRLTFLGPVEDSPYFQNCKIECEKLPQNVKVEWLQERVPEKVEEELSLNHFFISATLGENFGHAIFEAVSSGKPVIISDRTQWRGLSLENVGFDLPLENPDEWEVTVQACIDMDNQTYAEASHAAEKYAGLFRNNEELLKKNLNLFGAI